MEEYISFDSHKRYTLSTRPTSSMSTVSTACSATGRCRPCGFLPAIGVPTGSSTGAAFNPLGRPDPSQRDNLDEVIVEFFNHYERTDTLMNTTAEAAHIPSPAQLDSKAGL